MDTSTEDPHHTLQVCRLSWVVTVCLYYKMLFIEYSLCRYVLHVTFSSLWVNSANDMMIFSYFCLQVEFDFIQLWPWADCYSGSVGRNSNR